MLMCKENFPLICSLVYMFTGVFAPTLYHQDTQLTEKLPTIAQKEHSLRHALSPVLGLEFLKTTSPCGNLSERNLEDERRCLRM